MALKKNILMRKLIGLTLLFTVLLGSCSRREPEPINYGKDPCDHCKMTIMDTKFGAEIVTSKGKVYKFDAAECMVDFMKGNRKRLNNQDDMLLTVNTAAPGSLIDARSAFFLKDEAFRSPMGGNLAAFTTRQMAEHNLQTADGEVFTWDELLNVN